MSNEAKCPVMGDARMSTVAGARKNSDWWPNQLNLKPLNQNSPLTSPMGAGFDYAEEFRAWI